MTSRQISLVRQSWAIVGKLDPVDVGSLFYSRLMEVNPATRPLFRNPIPEQSKKIIAMISFVIANLDNIEDILEDIRKLARRHVGYGVQKEHYEQGGAALIWTLQKGLGENWNEELEEAWTACYATLANAMIEASEVEL
ncbi:MAG: globin family protein [Chitinophagaceae bacterium]